MWILFHSLLMKLQKQLHFSWKKNYLVNANSSVGNGASKLGGLANATQSTHWWNHYGHHCSRTCLNCKLKVPQVYQANCAWIMHPNTLAYIQGLTAGAGNNRSILMGNTLSEDGPFTLTWKSLFMYLTKCHKWV
jgi:HK97 family phage major capsid protein